MCNVFICLGMCVWVRVRGQPDVTEPYRAVSFTHASLSISTLIQFWWPVGFSFISIDISLSISDIFRFPFHFFLFQKRSAYIFFLVHTKMPSTVPPIISNREATITPQLFFFFWSSYFSSYTFNPRPFQTDSVFLLNFSFTQDLRWCAPTMKAWHESLMDDELYKWMEEKENETSA